MNRSVALVAFLALSWSHVAGLRCDMGAGATSMAAVAPSDSPAPADQAHAGHGANASDTGPPAPHHGTGHGCLMIMACSVASPRPTHPAAMIHIPTVLFTAAFPTPPTPVAADLAVDTPPPRRTV